MLERLLVRRDDAVLRLVAGAGSSVHDLTVRLPQNLFAGAGGLVTRNAARRIEVIDEDPTQVIDRYGVTLYDGGTLDDSSVTLGNTAKFASEVEAIAEGLRSDLSPSGAKSELETAAQRLASSYQETFGQIDCE